jgi:hypothetical protein
MFETILSAISHRLPRLQELTIAEMLSDSIVQALMEADAVDPETLVTALQNTAAHGAASYSPVAHGQGTSASGWNRIRPFGSGVTNSATVSNAG